MTSESEFIKIGYGHVGLIGSLRPDIAYPERKIRPGGRVVTTITSKPCECDDEHVEVFVRRLD